LATSLATGFTGAFRLGAAFVGAAFLGAGLRAATLFFTFPEARFATFTLGTGLRTRLLESGFLGMAAFQVMQVFMSHGILQNRHHRS
jgi:hypothetical protein